MTGLPQPIARLPNCWTHIGSSLQINEWYVAFLYPNVSLLVVRQIIRKNPDVEWWSHVLSWNRTYGSGSWICFPFLFFHWFVSTGARSWWSGWMIDFLMAGRLSTIIWYWFVWVLPNQCGEAPKLPEWDDVGPSYDSGRRIWRGQNCCGYRWLHCQG